MNNKVISAGAVWLLLSIAIQAEMKKPNIVFFLVDDLGKGDISGFGSTFHETPSIDALCAKGMKFTQAYSACTVCSPSRAAILTGCYPGRLHLTDWIAGHKKPFAKLSVPVFNYTGQIGYTNVVDGDLLTEKTGIYRYKDYDSEHSIFIDQIRVGHGYNEVRPWQ